MGGVMNNNIIIIIYRLCLVVKPHHTHEHNISQHVKDDTENGKKKKWWKKLIKGNHKNIILRIVFIHAVGDLMLSIGLVIAGYIIKFLVSKIHCNLYSIITSAASMVYR